MICPCRISPLWLKIYLLLPLILIGLNTFGFGEIFPGEISEIRIRVPSGVYCFWELYSSRVSDFLSNKGDCAHSQAEIIQGQGTSEIRVRWKVAGNYFYKVTVIDLLGCTNVSVGRIVVKRQPEEGFFIPEGFSPGYDGIHDEFRILGIEDYPDACLKVFDRKGQMIFKKEKYGNLAYWGFSRDAWWYGETEGAGFISQGSYLYVLVLNSRITIRGTVTVAYQKE